MGKTYRIKNAKFSGYFFHMNMNMQGDFQICISVPLITIYILKTKYFNIMVNIKRKYKIMNTYRNLNVIMKYVSPHMNFQGKNTKPRLFKNFTKYQEKIMKSRPDFPNHDKIVSIKIKTGGSPWKSY